MILLTDSERAEANAELAHDLKELTRRQAADIVSLQDEAWALRQRLFQHQYPDLWERLKGNEVLAALITL